MNINDRIRALVGDLAIQLAVTQDRVTELETQLAAERAKNAPPPASEPKSGD